MSVFMALSTVLHSINSPDSSPLSPSARPVLFLPYWSFQLYISLWKSPSAPSPRGLTFTWWERYGSCRWHKPTELAHSFLFCSCVCSCLYGPFNCILFHKFSRQLSVFSLCSSGLISALLVLSTMYLFYESLPQPWYNPLWLTGLQSTRWLTNQLSLKHPGHAEALPSTPVLFLWGML